MDPDELNPTPEDLGFEGITSRYTDIEGVVIDLDKVPERMRDLIPYARHWCIGDDSERADLMWLTPKEELEAFVRAVRPHYEAIATWCDSHDGDIPVPDEVVAFQQMAQAAAEAEACHVDVEE